MQKLHKPQPEIGDTVLIDWPRTRWDGRQGVLMAYRDDMESTLYACVFIDQSSVSFKASNIRKMPSEPGNLKVTRRQAEHH